jgi:hypothetical protein
VSGEAPVFIIGAARSGTKFFRGVLEGSARFRVIPYDVNYVWRTGNERHPDDALPPEALTPAIARYIRRTLPRLAGLRAPGDGVLVEKTVSNTLRVDFVRAVYPEGRFVHLVRDGRAVAESALRMWREPPQRGYLLRKLRHFPLANYRYAAWYAGNVLRGRLSGRSGVRVWGPRYPGIDRDLREASLATVCARQWAASVRCASDALERVPEGQRITLRYEDLASGHSGVRRLCEFLSIPDTEAVLERHRSTLQPPQPERWRKGLTPGELEDVLAAAGPELRRLGYADYE